MPKKKVSSRKKRTKKVATQTRSTTSSTTDKTATKKKSVRKTPAKKAPVKKGPVQKAQKVKKNPAETQQQTQVYSSPANNISSSNFLKTTDSPDLLSVDVQYAYISLLSRGASPAAACSQLGILLAEVIWSLEQISEFASMVDRVQELLSQNVAAALYRSAMEGSVSAQQNYLKAYPPPGSSATETDSMTNPEQELTEEELIEYLKAEAKAFLAEFDPESKSTDDS